MSEIILSLISAFIGGGFASTIFDYIPKRGLDKIIEEKAKIELERQRVELEKSRDSRLDKLIEEKTAAEVEKLNLGNEKARRESEAELKKLGEQQENQRSEIEDLKFLFASILTDYERSHLKNLNSLNQFTYSWNNDFKTELSRLLALHFIERRPNKGIRTAKADTRSDNDLREHFLITEKGKQYLGRLETLEQTSNDIEA